MKCKLVDVFAKQPLSGNGLTIFYDFDSLSTPEMQNLTREMRQFESIFVSNTEQTNQVRARIFTMEEELDFAGHPIIGLAAHLHEISGTNSPQKWQIELNQTTVEVYTEKTPQYFRATMNQGKPDWIKTLEPSETTPIIEALNLQPDQLSQLPIQVVSTGLPYLIVPLSSGLENAKITHDHFEALLESHGAKFAYLININSFEGRTWDNDGSVEDIATGSAAGPVAAYLYQHRQAPANQPIIISQGRFVHRPSEIEVTVETIKEQITNIYVSGDVVKVADIDFAAFTE